MNKYNKVISFTLCHTRILCYAIIVTWNNDVFRYGSIIAQNPKISYICTSLLLRTIIVEIIILSIGFYLECCLDEINLLSVRYKSDHIAVVAVLVKYHCAQSVKFH